jgi:hypothetical protein
VAIFQRRNISGKSYDTSILTHTKPVSTSIHCSDSDTTNLSIPQVPHPLQTLVEINMVSLLGLLNRFLPFATPGTPLLQDLIHLGAICTLLYYAPQIQHWAQKQQHPTGEINEVRDDGTVHLDNTPPAPHDGEPREPAVANENADQHTAPDDFEDVPNDDLEGEDVQADVQEGQPGPAGPANVPAHRNVGAKKAKSLARKDQRRAYNEFMRSQGDAQRAEDAKDAAEREAALAAERERRKAATAALEAKKAKEREQKREAERKQRDEEIRCRELAITLVKEALDDQRMCDLFKVAKQVSGEVNEEWVERIVRSSELVGMRNGVLTMITSVGWAIRVSQQDVRQLYENAAVQDMSDESGAVSYDQLGSLFENILKERTVTV